LLIVKHLVFSLSSFALALIWLSSCSSDSSGGNRQSSNILDKAKPTNTDKINGVSFVSPPRKIGRELIEIPQQEVHANALSIMPYGFVGSESTEVIFNSRRQWWGERSEGCAQLIEMAQKEGYRVLLKPQVWKRGGAYTGKHDYLNEKDWQAFEKSYGKFILHYAALADSLEVDFFAIGTEWENFVNKRPLFWKQLISKVKDIYKGKVTYAANWDEYSRVPFWEDLDLIGVDAYFPLVESRTPSVKEMKASLQTVKHQLKNFSDSLQKLILFTEYGYRSRDYNALRPWESERGGTVNLLAQENAYTAFYEIFWKESFVAGGFIWKWFPNDAQSGGENHSGFSPQNKPVEEVIRRYY